MINTMEEKKLKALSEEEIRTVTGGRTAGGDAFGSGLLYDQVNLVREEKLESLRNDRCIWVPKKMEDAKALGE